MDLINNKISIIIPTYNRSWCIGRAIDSVVNQTSVNWEIIIVDDGSTDNTTEVVEPYLKDSRIHYVKIENGGVGKARNIGVTFATSNYISFLDSDDEFTSDAVSTMLNDLNLLETHSVVVYVSKKSNDSSYVDKSLVSDRVVTFEQAVGTKTTSSLWPSVETVQLLKKSVFSKYGFPELPGGGESSLWFKLLKYEGSVYVRSKILREYHTEHDDRLTSITSLINRSKTMPIILTGFLDEFEIDLQKNPKRLSGFYFEKGLFELINGKAVQGRRTLLQSFQYHKSIVILVAYIISYIPTKLLLHVIRFGYYFKKILR